MFNKSFDGNCQMPKKNIFHKDSLFCKSLIFILIGVFLLIGLFSLRQYGAPWDEREEITIFIGNLKEYARLFAGESCEFNRLAASIDYATDNANIDHGESVYYILAPFAKMFLTGNHIEFIYMWRTVILLVCCLGILFLYLAVTHLTKDRRYGALSALLMILSPRFFAEATYNHKDLAQLTLWLAMFYFSLKWMEKRSYRWAIALGITAGFAINMRFAAAMGYFVCGAIYCIFIFSTTFKQDKKAFTKGVIQGVVSVASCLGLLFLITPGAWQGIVRYIIYCLTQSASFPWGGRILFAGELYPASDLVGYYLPVMIAITIPVILVPLFLFGNATTIFGVKTSEKTSKRRLYFKFNWEVLLLIGMTYFPLLIYFVMQPVVYNGWRHYYFLYGFIIIWAVLGYKRLFDFAKKNIKIIAAALMALQICSICVIIAISHPFQFTYYNFLAGVNPEDNYEMDYWGVSGKETLIEFIDKKYEGEPLKIAGFEQNARSILNRSIFVLPDEYSQKVEFIEEIEDADYVFVNYTYVNEYRNNDLFVCLDYYEEVVRTEYLSSPLAAVYKTLK